MTAGEARAALERRRGRRDELAGRARELRRGDARAGRRGRVAAEALAVVREVERATQAELGRSLERIAGAALAAVFPDPYSLRVEFVEARGQVEARITYERDGVGGLDPLDEAGLGTVDVASLALRAAVWRLGRGRALLVLDEPTKWVSEERQGAVGDALVEISRDLGLQVILVTHSEELAARADRTWRLLLEGGRTRAVEEQRRGGGGGLP